MDNAQNGRLAERNKPDSIAAPLARLRNVRKSFISGGRRHDVLADVSFEIGAGEFVSLVGPSGSGKSTILNLLAGTETPSAGLLTYHGAPVRGGEPLDRLPDPAGQPAGVAHGGRQHRVPLEIRRVSTAERGRAVREMLGKVGLAGYGDHYPRQLSGGMQKRAMLARTLIYDRQDHPDGRAVRGARCAVEAAAADGVAAALERVRQDHRVRHPRHRRGRHSLRPGSRPVDAADAFR